MNKSYEAIRVQISEECATLNYTQSSELTKLRQQHADEVSEMNNLHRTQRQELYHSHMELWDSYRENKGRKGGGTVAHNKRVKQQNLLSKMRIEYGCRSDTLSDCASELVIKLKDMAKTYSKADGKERSRLEKTEEIFRKAIVMFADEDASILDNIPWISAQLTEAIEESA